MFWGWWGGGGGLKGFRIWGLRDLVGLRAVGRRCARGHALLLQGLHHQHLDSGTPLSPLEQGVLSSPKGF